ncbi:chemotaxis protein CheC [Candidatus Woesearchaeota archaeon]|nr:chemotaxis protein CheC [Candidatus Woesearchaeota archaeon]
MENLMELSNMERDALRECANVGIGNAATALSKLLKKKINIQIPETKFIPLESFAEDLGGPEKIVSGIYLQIQGDLRGEVLFIFAKEEAVELINLLLGNIEVKSGDNSDLEESGFKEMSNIVTGSYLNAMANMLDIKILPSIPHTATDMLQALVDHILIELGKYSDDVLTVKTQIDVEGHNVKGTFVIIFTADSLKVIMSKLHEKYGV